MQTISIRIEYKDQCLATVQMISRKMHTWKWNSYMLIVVDEHSFSFNNKIKNVKFCCFALVFRIYKQYVIRIGSDGMLVKQTWQMWIKYNKMGMVRTYITKLYMIKFKLVWLHLHCYDVNYAILFSMNEYDVLPTI